MLERPTTAIEHVGFFLALGNVEIRCLEDIPNSPSIGDRFDGNAKTNRGDSKWPRLRASFRSGERAAPRAVTVVMSEDTLVVTLHGALSPAEKALARTPEGAAQVQEFHRQLFASDSDALRQEIKRITGIAVREATAEVEPASGAIVQAFTTGTVVQVFLMDGSSPTETWSGASTGGDH